MNELLRSRGPVLLPALPALVLGLALQGCGSGGGGGGGGTPPQDFDYDRDLAVYSVGVEIADNGPNLNPAPNSYTIDKALPAGLSFDLPSGVISGTPTVVAAPETYTITAVYSSPAPEAPEATLAEVRIEVARAGRILYVGQGEDTVSRCLLDPVTGDLSYLGYETNLGGGSSLEALVPHPLLDVVYVIASDPAPNGLVSWFEVASDGSLALGGSIQALDEPFGLLISPAGTHAWVLNRGTNPPPGGFIQTFDVDPVSGALSPIGGKFSAPTGKHPDAMTFDPTGSVIYVTNGSDDDQVQAFSIDAGTGELTAMPASTLPAGSDPIDIVVPPGLDFAYVANSNLSGGVGGSLSIYGILPSGDLTPVSELALANKPIRLTAEATGQFLFTSYYLSSSIQAFSIDATTGLLTAVGGPIAAGSGPFDLVADPTGLFLYTASSNSDAISVFSIDPGTGGLTARDAIPCRAQPFHLALWVGNGPVAEVAEFAYVLNQTSTDIWPYEVDGATLTGVGTPPPPLTGMDPLGLAVDPLGEYAYASSSGEDEISQYQIEADGDLTEFGVPIDVGTGTEPGAVVIEPSGRYLYCANHGSDTIAIFDIDRASGQLSAASTPSIVVGSKPLSLAVDPTGEFLILGREGSSQNRHLMCFRIQPSDGSLSLTADMNAGGIPSSVAVDRRGEYAFHVTNTEVLLVHAIDRSTGALTLAGTKLNIGTAPASIALSPKGYVAYVANNDPLVASEGEIRMYEFNPGTGAVVHLGTEVTLADPACVRLDPGGRHLFVGNQGTDDVSSYAIDPTTRLIVAPASATALTGQDPVGLGVVRELQ